MNATKDGVDSWSRTRSDRLVARPRARRVPARGRTQFHVLSFEGPDAYSMAGGLASRVIGLTRALAAAGHETHLWFVGDAGPPGHEVREGVHLHRWCQWLSRSCPAGVYDGEEAKQADYATSLPPYLLRHTLLPHLAGREAQAVILAEEWQTVGAVLHLDALLRTSGLRDRVAMLWNANNTFGFSRIPWERLARAARITTVSRYMKALMSDVAPHADVIPNGLSVDAYEDPEARESARFSELVHDRMAIAKVGRFDPDKRWIASVDAVAELKRLGERPLLIARGGVEDHGREVVARAKALGLEVVERRPGTPDPSGLLDTLEPVGDADIVILTSSLSPSACRLLFRGAFAVLADSVHEPFGLVGLEAMAMRGLACTGGTGEDYAEPGRNALVLRHGDPKATACLLSHVRHWPAAIAALTERASQTAKDYSWDRVIPRSLLPVAEAGSAA